MEANRAKEIIGSSSKIEVVYKDNSVWIENVDASTSTANVKIMRTNEVLKVPVNELNETGNTIQ